MFGDVNSVTLLGNITNDLTVRYTPNGKAVMSFGLATNRRYKLPDSEEWKDEPTFHNIVLFGNQAEFLAKKGRKGTKVYVTGRLQTRKWDDKEGKTNYKTEIVVDRILLIDRYERGAAGAKGDFHNAGGGSGAGGGNGSGEQDYSGYDMDGSSSGASGGGNSYGGANSNGGSGNTYSKPASSNSFSTSAASAKTAPVKSNNDNIIDPDDLPF